MLRTAGATLSALLVGPSISAAEQGDWRVRTGPIGVFPSDESDAVFGGKVGVSDAYGLGLTVGYQITERFGIEFLGASPISHDLEGEGGLAGLGDVGEVKQLSPTLTVQYYPELATDWVAPYVGIGASYTTFYEEDSASSLSGALGDPDAAIRVDDSASIAFQVGADWPVSEQIAINSALWYVDLDTQADITANGATTTVDVAIEPWVAMIGATYHF
jgi:outer membrane protein